ncbi:MAG: diphosphomevalonate decarboxylase [Flavobacteriales bacterium]|jgi:diphosphomevalonate decarboxylase
MTIQDFIPKPYTEIVDNGSVSYQSPSNIALVKYWGKYGEQLPQNASVSFTLRKCRTETTVHYKKKNGDSFDFEVYLDGTRELGFEPKIQKFFERVARYIPFIKKYRFIIKTKNSFPHSSGIASSASGISALAMCLVAIEKLLSFSKGEETQHNVYSLQKASFLARLGSGSAARSLEGPLVVWGEHPKIEGSSNLFGTRYPNAIHENFSNYQDTILLVDKGEKQVSSTVGHDLMHHNAYAKERFKEANNNLEKLISIFEQGDLGAFITLVESEALQLHAMMMASKPYFILMKPNTLEILNRIWTFRNKTGSNVCFTLDAGANVHVLYPASEKEKVCAFIENELAQFCKNREFIHDAVGLGATAL